LPRSLGHDALQRDPGTDVAMTETELHIKLDEIDRILNDPETSLEASRVWSLLAEVSLHDRTVNPART
jgi:hypothetical protein